MSLSLQSFRARGRRGVTALVAASIFSAQVAPAFAAVPTCMDGYAADRGNSPGCAAVRIGGTPLGFPKLIWTDLARLPVGTGASSNTAAVRSGVQTELLANRTAQALGLDPAQVANAVATFPSNVPYVFARYNPMDLTLRVDVFKVEKTTGAGGPTAVMQQMQFTPAHGRIWEANRSYISPDRYRLGSVAGRNPFEAFARVGSDNFHAVNMNAAQVIVGHAMRATGAGVAMMGIAQPRLSSRTTKSGGVFKKTVRTWVYGHAKTTWMVGMPWDALDRTSAGQSAAYCVTDPSSTSCPLYEVANSGVAFETMTGGTLVESEDTWELDFKKSSGLTFAGGLLFGGLLGFGLGGMFALATDFVAFTAMNGGGMAWVTSPDGVRVSTQTVDVGLSSTPFSTRSAAGNRMVSGANLATTADPAIGLTATLSGLATVGAGTAAAPSLDNYNSKLNSRIRVTTTSDPTGALTDAKNTLFGGCSAGSTSCAASSGVVPRVNGYVRGDYGFLRDGSGTVLRDSGTLFGEP